MEVALKRAGRARQQWLAREKTLQAEEGPCGWPTNVGEESKVRRGWRGEWRP